MHTLTVAVSALIVNPLISAYPQISQSTPELGNSGNASISNLGDDDWSLLGKSAPSLKDRSSRVFTCNVRPGRDLTKSPRIIDCLPIILRLPTDGNDIDIKRKQEGGFLPMTLGWERCGMLVEFTDPSVRQERTSWLAISQAASNSLFVCKRGDDGRTSGTVVIGEQGLIKVSFAKREKRPDESANEENELQGLRANSTLQSNPGLLGGTQESPQGSSVAVL